MPLTQEKRLDNFSNNNDHSYLHKKFKKMASTISVLPANSQKSEENVQRDPSLVQSVSNTSITNGSIAAAHPEIEKIKDKYDNQIVKVENYVQINYNDENIRLNDVNNIIFSGKTSYSDEFLKKTENYENDSSRDGYSGGAGRYVCPYCKLPCAKPSVLQKHIRAHTNERPYPCVPCGFAFKTKSNLYKHRRSRTHALRSQGADMNASIIDEDLSGGSESDTSATPASISDTGSDASVLRLEHSRPHEFSSPELTNDITSNIPFNCDNKSKTIYKPKFRAAFYQGNEEKDKIKKNITTNADFLTEHISKIISDNEAIVDVIETPLQKKYNKIKQIAESKQFFHERDNKQEISPLNLTKNTYESESQSRKRSHSESFAGEEIKHPLNPEGSIIKDLLLKTKANGITSLIGELEDGVGPLFICPLCQIIYRSADNLEIHRLYYCKGNLPNITSGNSMINKCTQSVRPENVYLRSNSINVRLTESQNQSSDNNITIKSPSLKNKPDNLTILKPENDVIAPLPSPGPLLGNTRLVDTRLVDTRLPVELNRSNEHRMKTKDHSPRRRLDSRSDSYSPRLMDNASPRSVDLYPQAKIRCIENNSTILRSIEELQTRHNSTSLQMFGGEVKIVDHSGSTTTLRIEPSKNQLSPIMIQQNLSPSKFLSDSEASSVVVRSGLHSGGTIVQNPPTPKENIINTSQTPRIAVATPNIQNAGMININDITHFQFPPLSAITAYNPLTLPPLSPTSSPNGATSILHGGKIIPHVPGIPGPNTTGIYVGNTGSHVKTVDMYKSAVKVTEGADIILQPTASKTASLNLDKEYNARNSKFLLPMTDIGKYDHVKEIQNNSVPLITVKNVDNPNLISKNYTSLRTATSKQENHLKRNADGIKKTITSKDNGNYSGTKYKEMINFNKNNIKQVDSEIKSFNFENLITKAEIYNNQIQSSSDVQKNTNAQDTSHPTHNDRSEKSYFQKNKGVNSASEERKPKFLRPSSLPLKPGTFTPKRHHGITPNANTMPLISPETPRPAKAYGQLYLNGNAYTYLGLKCSTKVFYCTINRPQPTYVPNQHFLSMYSNWQLLSELTPDPLGLSASSAMSLYDSRHRPQTVTVAMIKQDLILTHSSQWNNFFKDKQTVGSIDMKKEEDNASAADSAITNKKELAGGFESNEEYTYVRGRGRGRYVCLECGIRCKKPSMLKKHIRTHTDVRPYTCIHCVFSFKTKGNLTKHMKSKAHYKKCCELGINPTEGNDSEGIEMHPCPEESDDESESEGDDGNEGETESSDTEFYKSRLPEHEAAHCLLSLGGNRITANSTTPGLITSARPSTYPYSPIMSDNAFLDFHTETIQETKNIIVQSRLENDNNEPMDLSKNDSSTPSNIMEIPTARESSVLASLASNTAKLPQHQSQWVNGEPMLHTYLTERALLDSKIKQSQLASNSTKLRKIEIDKSMFNERNDTIDCHHTFHDTNIKADISKIVTSHDIQNKIVVSLSKGEEIMDRDSNLLISNGFGDKKPDQTPSNSNSENAKQVVSEYLKQARISMMKTYDESNVNENLSDDSNSSKINVEDKTKIEEVSIEGEMMKQTGEDSMCSNIVIGGVSFKVNKDKEFDSSSMPFSPSKLMDDGRRVCDFCNKTFTKPSQLKLHLNIHYMERPFRCSVCAVSFRTKGHLQKHERSGSHHNKVSMTSTFGAATSFNPRPFRCSDCNIAFRIHGHLAKHLRSKMHVMRLECLFKLPFGTFTEIERAGLSLTDIDTTDCASSLASLQCLARKLHEKDPTRLEYRERSISMSSAPPAGREVQGSSEDEEVAVSTNKQSENEIDSEKTSENMEWKDSERNTFSATDN